VHKILWVPILPTLPLGHVYSWSFNVKTPGKLSVPTHLYPNYQLPLLLRVVLAVKFKASSDRDSSYTVCTSDDEDPWKAEQSYRGTKPAQTDTPAQLQ
jgi:hypothetical protein